MISTRMVEERYFRYLYADVTVDNKGICNTKLMDKVIGKVTQWSASRKSPVYDIYEAIFTSPYHSTASI